MTGWRRWLRMTAILAVVLVLYFTVPVTFEVRVGDVAQLVVSVVALALLAAAVISEVRLQLLDADRRIDGLVLALMIAVLGFALGFYVLELRDPGQIAGLETRLDSLYFTMTTLLTVGYGDIHAVGQSARAVVLIQMVFNVVIITTAATTLTTRIRSRATVAAETRRSAQGDGSAHEARHHGRRTHRNPR